MSDPLFDPCHPVLVRTPMILVPCCFIVSGMDVLKAIAELKLLISRNNWYHTT